MNLHTPDNSAVSLVNHIIEQAVHIGASDVHIESHADGLRVRYRIDGVLYDQEQTPPHLAAQTLSRIKICAKINIAEKRIPQDGKFVFVINEKEIDLRVSTFPSLYGEKIVIRILDRAAHDIALENLGMAGSVLDQFKDLIARSSGFFLVTGPTGSGKTTTLYAALSRLNVAQKNIVTLEDPVEYNLVGVTQGQIHPEAGFTFERGIRAILRQDPDVAMLGEIRDKQTARIAIEAALSGHLVFSTLHTNDAPSTVMRLVDMGTEPFLVNAAVSGVLAQRLARKICKHCCHHYQPTADDLRVMHKLGVHFSQLFKGTGCQQCHGLGYKGRIGIFELLVMSNGIRACIVERPQFDIIYKQAVTEGMQTLLHDGAQKVRDGIITLQELVHAVS